MANRLKALKVDFVSLVPRGANQDANFVLAKSDDTPTQGEPTTVTGTAATTTATEAAVTITKADLDTAIATAIAKQAETYEAKLSESSAAVEKLNKALEETTTRAQQAELVAKAEQDARETAVAIAKAEKEMGHLPSTTPAEVGALLRTISKGVSADDLVKLENILKAASEAVNKSGLFDERGSSASIPGTADGEGAFDQLQKVAKSLQEKESALTTAQAIAKASSLRPDLVQADRSQRGFTPAGGYRQYR